MTRHDASGWTHGAIGAAALFFSLSVLPACSLPPGQFVIIQNQVPAQGCAIPAGASNVYRGQGTLDVRLVLEGATAGYDVYPLMRNNLPASMGGSSADPNRIKLSSFDVDLGVPAGAPSPAMSAFLADLEARRPDLLHYGILTSGSIASGGGNTSSLVDAFPADLAREIRGSGILKTTAYVDLMTTIHARGSTDSGRSVKSDPFAFPIRVCDGCLIASLGTCPVTTAPANLGNDCNIAQDQPVDCCLLGNGLVCPPTVTAGTQ